MDAGPFRSPEHSAGAGNLLANCSGPQGRRADTLITAVSRVDEQVVLTKCAENAKAHWGTE